MKTKEQMREYEAKRRRKSWQRLRRRRRAYLTKVFGKGNFTSLWDSGLSTRAVQAIHGIDIERVEDLSTATRKQLLDYPNFGIRSLREVESFLASRGERLAG